MTPVTFFPWPCRMATTCSVSLLKTTAFLSFPPKHQQNYLPIFHQKAAKIETNAESTKTCLRSDITWMKILPVAVTLVADMNERVINMKRKPVTILAVSRRQISTARIPGMLALCKPYISHHTHTVTKRFITITLISHHHLSPVIINTHRCCCCCCYYYYYYYHYYYMYLTWKQSQTPCIWQFYQKLISSQYVFS